MILSRFVTKGIGEKLWNRQNMTSERNDQVDSSLTVRIVRNGDNFRSIWRMLFFKLGMVQE